MAAAGCKRLLGLLFRHLFACGIEDPCRQSGVGRGAAIISQLCPHANLGCCIENFGSGDVGAPWSHMDGFGKLQPDVTINARSRIPTRARLEHINSHRQNVGPRLEICG